VGPLDGFRVVELVGLGPGPFAGMLLADLGAEVLRVDRLADASVAGASLADRSQPARNVLHRGKASVAVDLKTPGGVEVVLRLAARADALIEVFRPGVAERLGIGPEACMARNPGLIYGRLTGWGQDGPWADRAGHDIDYIALAGALEPLGREGGPPTPPINVLGDFAGGGLLLAFGIMCAAWSGGGQVIDAAMIDGAALLMAPFFTGRATGSWGPRGTNLLDTAAPFYDVYATSDGGWMAVGAIEPKFHAALLAGLGVTGPWDQYDRSQWPAQKARLAEIFRTRTRDEWSAVFAGTDACVAPVLDPVEAPAHPHHAGRATFVDRGGVMEPGPAPRFSRTPAGPAGPTSHAGEDTDAALAAWGFAPAEVAALRTSGAVA
jgi:alpha-methylacyl-CoA racemase